MEHSASLPWALTLCLVLLRSLPWSCPLSGTGCCSAPTRADHAVSLLPSVPPWEIHLLGSYLVFSLRWCEVGIDPCCSAGSKAPAVWSSGKWLVAWWARMTIMCKKCLINICQDRGVNCVLGQALLLFTLWRHLRKTKGSPWSLPWRWASCMVLKRTKASTDLAQSSFSSTVFAVATLHS